MSDKQISNDDMKPDKPRIATLEEWGKWGKSCFGQCPDWAAVDSLIRAADVTLTENSARLRELLQRSAGYLRHDDPLLCAVGTHRWLVHHETSYSDWLVWVLERLCDAKAVLRVLGIKDPRFAAACAGEYTVQREVPLLKGLPGCKGQIDLLIRFGNRAAPWRPSALLGIEVKTYDEQYQKQKGYLTSLKKLCPRYAKGVLVANDEPEHCYGFTCRRWRDVCLGLRAVATDGAIQSGFPPAVRVMMLAFVAAVEQNIMGLDVASGRRAWRGRGTLCPESLLSYLQQAVEEEERGYSDTNAVRSVAAGG